MKLTMSGLIRETENCKGPWFNTLIGSNNSKQIVFDRDETEFTVHEYDPSTGYAKIDIQWNNVYIWDGETCDYDIPEDFIKHTTFDNYDIEEDADENYDLIIDLSTICYTF